MSTSKLLARASAVALFASFLTACGGGGGGGSGDVGTNTGGPGGNPGDNDGLVAISLENGKQLVFTAQIMASLAESAVLDGAASIASSMSAVASQGSIDESFDCDSGGSMTVKGSAKPDLTGEVTITYHNCVDYSSDRYNGTLRLTLRDSHSGMATAYDYSYENYRYDTPALGHGLAYSGKFSVDPDGNERRFNATLTVTDMSTQEAFSVAGYVARYAIGPAPSYPFSPIAVATYRSGLVKHSIWGSANIGHDPANANRNYLDGANRSRLRFDTLPNVDSLHLSLDADGDGAFERFAWVPSDSLAYIISPNTAPTVNVSVPLVPEGIGQQITVPFDGVSDAQFDFLRYSVTMQQSPGPVGNFSQHEDGSFSFLASSRGTYVFLLTVDDGRGGTTTQTISIDIKLPAPNVQAPTSIDANTNGALVSMSVQPTNSAAGPFNYRLVSGPSGMTVDGQGNVQWQPAIRFFDRVEVRAVVAIGNADHEIEVPLSLQVTDASRAKPLVRSIIEGPTTNGNTFVLDFANDGVNRILATDNGHLIYTLKLQGGNYVQDWVFPYAQFDIFATIDHILPFDADHDGNYEVAVKSGGSIYIIGEDHETIDRRITLDAVSSSRMIAADIDADGHDELITIVRGGWQDQGVVLDAATLTERWRTPPLQLGADFAVGNVDGDAAQEIVFVGGYVFDGATHAAQWSHWSTFGHAGVSTGDIDGDGIGEIVGYTREFSGTSVLAFSAVSQSLLWTLPADNLGLGGMTLAQLDGDTALEIVTGDRFHGNVRAYDATSSSASLKWSVAESSGVTDLAVGDADNDGAADLLWGLANWAGVEPSITVFDPQNATRTFTTTDEPLKGGFRGGIAVSENNSPQVMFSSNGASSNQTEARFLTLDPASGTLVRSAAVDHSGIDSPLFCAFDYDSDGNDDVLFGTHDATDHYLESYSFFTQAQQWRKPGPPMLQVNTPQACGDFDGDGHMDIAWFTYGLLEITDAMTQLSLWSTALPENVGQLASGDIDGDGDAELLAISLTHLRKYRASGSGFVEEAVFSNFPVINSLEDRPRIALVDLDGDHKPEIVVTYPTYNFFVGTQLIVLNSDLTERSRSTVEGKIIAIAPDTIQQGHVLATVDGGSYPNAGRTTMIDVTTGAWIWRSPQLIGEPTPDSLHYNAAAPNGGSLSIGTSSAMYITR